MINRNTSSSATAYTKIIEDKQDALLRVKKEMKQTVTTGTTERNWVTLFKQYENVEELNSRVLNVAG